MTETIYSSDEPELALPQKSIFTVLFHDLFDAYPPSNPAFIDAASGETLSRADVKDLSLRFARGLKEVGIQQGDTILVFR